MLTTERLSEPTEHVISDREPWFVAGLLIASAPALHTLATWDVDGRLSSQAFAVRHYSYVIMLIELLVIWLAARNQLSIAKAISALPSSISVLLGAWFAFAVAALFSSISDLANAILILARYIIHGFFLIAVIHLIAAAKSFEMQRLLVIFVIGTVTYILLLTIFSILVRDPAKFAWVLQLPSATNVRQIGNNVGILMIAPVALLLSKRSPLYLPYAVAFIIALSFVVWTGSRATLLGFALGVAAGLVTVKNFTAIRNIVITAIAALVATGASLFIPIPDPAFGLFRLVAANGEQDASSGRWEMWAQAWHHVLQSPLIGHGSGRYRMDMNSFYGTYWNHPHNFILQYFYDWGFLGGSIALLLLALMGIKIFLSRDAAPIVRFTAITAYVAICSMAMIDGPLFHPLPIAVALALIAPVFVHPERMSNAPKI